MDVRQRIGGAGREMLAELTREPQAAALLSDVDGTLAPIVARPEDARVPAPVTASLRRLGERFGLLAFVSGRPAAEARELVGIGSAVYLGVHGLERLDPGAEEARLAPEAAGAEGLLARIRDDLDPGALAAAGVRVEDKGVVLALHTRGAADSRTAGELVERAARHAARLGLEVKRGRMVCELRPDCGIDKGVAIARLLGERELRRCLYAGDDATDVDAFIRLGEMAAGGALEFCARVGIISAEGPDAIADHSDIDLAGPEQMGELLAVIEEELG